MDIIFNNILVAFLCLLIGYLFGSIPVSVIIGKALFNQDPRDYGSKNAGGSNSGRLWGAKYGVLVIVIDMLKAALPFWGAWAILTFVPFGTKPLMQTVNAHYAALDTSYIIQWPVYWLVPLGTVIGHCWPVFSKFKGGKGVANFFGISITSGWMLGTIPSFSFLIVLKCTKMVSLSSMISSAIICIAHWVWAILIECGVVAGFESLPGFGATLDYNWVAALVMTLISAILIFQHRSNIKRIAKGEERKIKWMK